MILQAFRHVEVIGPHVEAGHFDLVGPDRAIILPQVWESMIEPNWDVSMHMWPMPVQPSSSVPVVHYPDRKKKKPKQPKGVLGWMAGVLH